MNHELSNNDLIAVLAFTLLIGYIIKLMFDYSKNDNDQEPRRNLNYPTWESRVKIKNNYNQSGLKKDYKSPPPAKNTKSTNK